MNEYYVEFETWADGKIEIPWPYVVFEETANYRSRLDPTQQVSASIVKNVFMTLNDIKCSEFFNKNVPGVIVGIELSATDANDVKRQICNFFGHCEFLGIVEVTVQNKNEIQKVMAGAIL